MTITYTGEVATSRYAVFLRLLLRWKGSIYKVVWPDFVVFSLLYTALSVIYRTALNEDQKRVFELISLYCDQYSSFIPLSFVLGFYVSVLMTRWWDQFTSIPWPDKIAILVSNAIKGQDERGRLMRRSIMRYVNLTYVLTFVMVSPRIKKRFPTMDHIVETGLMVPEEKEIIEKLTDRTKLITNFVPIVWACTIVTRAHKEKRIPDTFVMQTIINALNDYRGACGTILNYDWISMPLMYTQVVTLAVYTFFLASTMGRQWLDPKQGYPGMKIDLYIPIFTMLQFFFYMGWLKVGETLINPFGEDGDDFEMNYMVDRNIQYGYVVVDEMHEDHPELIRDQYWDNIYPDELPYTIAAEKFKRDHPPLGSTAGLKIPLPDSEYANLAGISYGHKIGDTEDIYENMDSPMSVKGTRRKRNISINSSLGKRSIQGTESARNVITNFFRRSLRTSGIEHTTNRSVKNRPRHPSPCPDGEVNDSVSRMGTKRRKKESEEEEHYTAFDEDDLEEIVRKLSDSTDADSRSHGALGTFKSDSQKKRLIHLYRSILMNLPQHNRKNSHDVSSLDGHDVARDSYDESKMQRKPSWMANKGEVVQDKRKISDISERTEIAFEVVEVEPEPKRSLKDERPEFINSGSVDSGIYTKESNDSAPHQAESTITDASGEKFSSQSFL